MHDLHSHSTYSDGTLTPSQLVARAAQRGVKVLALTDHDHTGGLPEARAAAEEHGLRLLDGVEISVTWHDQTIHVVGLGISADKAALQTGLAATRRGRTKRAEAIAAALESLGIGGALEGAQQYVGNPDLISRTHFARYLVNQGVVKHMDAAFRRFLGAGQPAYVPLQWATLQDAVGWIRASGGVAVIAHPGRYPLDDAAMREMCVEFAALGGEAIEVVTGSHKPQHYRIFAKLAQELDLAASCGSDFHSPQESRHDLGSLPALPAGCRPVWEIVA